MELGRVVRLHALREIIGPDRSFAFLRIGEGGFAFLRKSHGGCDSPPDCRQEPPFESTF